MRKDNIPLLKVIAHGRICKQPLLQPTPQLRRKWRGREQLAPMSVGFRQVLPEHHERVMFIYNKIEALSLPLKSFGPHVPSSDIHEAEMGVIRLEYRKGDFQSLVRHIYNDSIPRLTQLTRLHVKTLRAILEHDIPILYNAHIPYKLDISTMLITKAWSWKLQREIFKPLIDSFNLDLDPQDDSIPWVAHRESVLKSAGAQFAVIEAIAEAITGYYNPPPTSLQPDVATDVLEKCRPPIEACSFVIRYVARYSTNLGRYMSRLAGNYLLTLPSRRGASECHEELAQDLRNAVAHVLRLADAPAETEDIQQEQLLADRVALLTVYAALLVHIHAKDIICDSSRHLLTLEKDETSEMYTGTAQFKVVRDARRRLTEAICALRAVGGELDDEARWFIEEHG